MILAAFASTTSAAEKAAADPVHAINTVCPVTGKKIDPKVVPQVVELANPSSSIAVGLCSEECRATVAKDAEKFAKAAITNKKKKD
ncbi:MAG: hypothetical protein H0V44_15945 [Planctomycetes bacterium]|nr:hypothetical protein [Planctomycetota bacterium]